MGVAIAASGLLYTTEVRYHVIRDVIGTGYLGLVTAAGFAQLGSGRDAASTFAGASGPQTRFTGYESEEQRTTVAALQPVGDGAVVNTSFVAPPAVILNGLLV